MNEVTQKALELPIVWQLDEPLAQISFFRDWDYATSVFSSLKYYWHTFGTIPTWDITMCGGKPTLANPNHWAFTWQSLFAYFLPPIWAALTLWALLTMVGLGSLWLLLRRFDCSRFGASCGTSIFVFNGFFSSHFNQGHQGFAALHLVPFLMLASDICLKRCLARQKHRRYFYLVVLVSVLFFTAAVPHGIFHFYPAYLLYLILRMAYFARQEGYAKSLRAVLMVYGAHILGLWIALYKIVPMAAWQLNFPRQGVLREHTGFTDIFAQYLQLVPDYFELKRYFPAELWGYWEYNAFIGPFALLAAFVSVICLAGRWYKKQKEPAHPSIPFGLALGCLCVISGVLLVLGNDHPLSPAALFSHLPLLNGIRVFGRYHVLDLFGLAVLVGGGMTLLSRCRALNNLKRPSRSLVQAVMMVCLCGPGLYQCVQLVWNIQGLPYSWLQSEIYRNTDKPPSNPVMIKPWVEGPLTTQTFLLDHGFFPATCYEPMANNYLNLSRLPSGSAFPLTSAREFSFADASTHSLSFDFGNDIGEKVQINLLLPASFTTNIPASSRTEAGLLIFDGDKLRHQRLTINTVIAADYWSALTSALGLLTTGGVFFLL